MKQSFEEKIRDELKHAGVTCAQTLSDNDVRTIMKCSGRMEMTREGNEIDPNDSEWVNLADMCQDIRKHRCENNGFLATIEGIGFMESIEQQLRDGLERMGIAGAQTFSAGDLVEIANLVSKAVTEEREACAMICEKRADARFLEHGHTEHDTNASYYTGAAAEVYEAQDEECEEIAAQIRARQ